MTTRALGPGFGWSWLARAVNLGRNDPKAVIGGIALLALVALVPSLLQVVFQYGFKAQPNAILTVAGLTTLLSIVIFPLLIGGVLRIIDAAEHGRPTRATAVFDTFRAGGGAGRLIGFGLLMTAIYLAVFVGIVGLFGKGFLEWYMQLMTLGMESGGKPIQPDAMPPPPEGLGPMMGLGLLFGLFFGGVYAIGFGQVALGGRGVLSSLGDGFAGALKNLLPIVVMAAISIVAFFALVLVVTLVGGLLALIGGLVHQALAMLLVLPVYLGMLLLIYVVMFGVMYHMWRDICAEPASPPPLPGNQVEL